MRHFPFIALALAASAFACSSSKTEIPAAAVDAGAPEPQSAADVPAVAIEANAETDCPGAYQGTAPKAGSNGGFEVAGQKRSFFLIEPEGAGDGPVPIFIALNGTGEDGPSFAKRANLVDFAKKGMLVVAPSSAGNGTTWPVWDSIRQSGTENNPNKDIDYMDTLLKCVAAHRPVDKNRVYVGGHSAGGIFTNNLIQRRSEVYAGAIVASGIFSQTSPDPVKDVDPMFVLVTWGGETDAYTGQAGGATITNFSFAPEASKASKFYATQLAVGHVACHGNDVGHVWLSPINNWMIDLLLEHPKGFSGSKGIELDLTVPKSKAMTCTTTPYEYVAKFAVTCEAGAKDGCQQACQLFGDCAVENGSVGGVLATQLQKAGFSGPNLQECGGCVSRCDQKAVLADDTAVLGCMKDQQKQNGDRCGQGVEGAFPLIDALNICCKDKPNSGYCKDMCGIINTNGAAKGYFKVCAAF